MAELRATRLGCQSCGTNLDGQFEIPALLQLSPDDLAFVTAFVRSSGSLKAMAQVLPDQLSDRAKSARRDHRPARCAGAGRRAAPARDPGCAREGRLSTKEAEEALRKVGLSMMTTPDERVRALVRDNVINPAEGERLLATMSPRPPQRGWRLALNPFERFRRSRHRGGARRRRAGTSPSTGLGVRFDGFLDLHARRLPSSRTGRRSSSRSSRGRCPPCSSGRHARLLRRRVRLIDFSRRDRAARARRSRSPPSRSACSPRGCRRARPH